MIANEISLGIENRMTKNMETTSQALLFSRFQAFFVFTILFSNYTSLHPEVERRHTRDRRKPKTKDTNRLSPLLQTLSSPTP